MNLNELTHLYPVSKTLRFELKPVGETADYIENFKSQYLKDIVGQDEKRAEDYKNIKEIIDDFHRDYIEKSLKHPCDKKTGELLFKSSDFENAFFIFENFKANPKDEKAKKEWVDVQSILRKKIVKAFPDIARLFSKDLVKQDLEQFLKNQSKWEENKSAVNNFKNFTTYFTGFHENRKNMYSSEDKSTAISFRLMNENLPKFFSNCIQYKRLIDNYRDFEYHPDTEILAKLNTSSIHEVFNPSFFQTLFTQSGIDLFNELLGGKTAKSGEKVKGLNEKLNLYRQKHGIKKREIPNFIILYKQILSDKESSSFIPEAYKNDKELLDEIYQLINQMTNPNGLLPALESAVKHLIDCDLNNTYVKGGLNLTNISQNIYGDYSIIKSAVYFDVANNIIKTPKNGKVTEQLEDKRRKYINNLDAFTIGELEIMLSNYADSLDEDNEIKKLINENENPIINYFLTIIDKTKNDEENPLEIAIENVIPLLELQELNKGETGIEQKQKIQKVLDAFLNIAHAVKPLHLVKGRKPLDLPNIDFGFYSDFSEAFELYETLIVGIYNKTRNHLTKKPYSKDKVKINFNNPTFLSGWDVNKAKGNNANILRKDGLYYLAIMHPRHNKIFDNINGDVPDGYEHINYKLVSGINKMLPKVFFSNKGKNTFNPPKRILDIYKNGEHKKGNTFNLESCRELIDWFKENVGKYKVNPTDEYGWEVFNFKFSPTETYEDISYFYKEIENQAYKLWFTNISESYINKCVEDGKLFLFQIYNKDYSSFSKGKPNLHTMYWESLFDPNNLKNVVAKLNGEAEMFYRKHSIKKDDRTIHSANNSLKNKNENNPKTESVFDYDIIKDKRYTVDKFHFHVPVTLNFKAPGLNRFNDHINNIVKKSDNTHVIGIDRGERHLLYFTVINSNGEIVEQGSFNTIKTDLNYEVDYHKKLDKKEKERELARKSWTTVETIKELKAGYLSHIIHQLALLIRKYNAIVCLEDLNFGFKRGRFKVEKQVYQKFEKALIDKLNYLVFKDTINVDDAGHCLNALQLTAPFDSFKKLGKQSGILYYVQAAYTSKIDPATGFMNFLNTRYRSLEKSKEFFEAMDKVWYNSNKNYFEFSFDYSKTNPDRDLTGYQTVWTICTHGDLRFKNIRNNHGKWESVPVNVTQEIKELFQDYLVEYHDGQDLKNSIILVKNTKFYKKLFKLLSVTFSLRHSKSGTDEDFILSPVADENGNFFDSRNSPSTMPKDADANGAYHIALKGLWNIQKIKEWDGKGKLNLAMKNVDWFSFAHQKPFKK